MNPSAQGPTNSDSLQSSTGFCARESFRALQTPLRYLKGIGPKRGQQLEVFGLETVEDLLYHLPFRYEDRRQIKKIAAAIVGQNETFVGRLDAVRKTYNPRRRAQMLVGRLSDDSGVIDLVWYRAPSYLVDRLTNGQSLLVHGRVEAGTGRLRRLVHPEFETLGPEEHHDLPKILPIYLRPGGLPLSLLRRWIAQSLDSYADKLGSCLPRAMTQRLKLMPLAQALTQLHRPANETDMAALNGFASTAHRTIILDEFFYLQLGLRIRKQRRAQTPGMALRRREGKLVAAMRGLLPFKLTRAQERVLAAIDADLDSDRVMQRLVQGDVGSGKTMVAWLGSLRVIENGYQAVWMAPTELLAEQHYRNIKAHADKLGISAALITGSQSAKERRTILAKMAAGEVSFVVGTHALIQENVSIPRMALGVIDEQHRFGVLQRLSLQRLTAGAPGMSQLSGQPHMLLMSATPIPRSLAMVLYGDLDVSFLDELPPGRTPVQTKVFQEQDRKSLYTLVLDELCCGHQVFVVYPLVESSEQLQQVRDATQMAERMRQGPFKRFGVGLVHGKMTINERDEVMRAFRDGVVGVLVSTTVIEVGIDIPNATVMVVEHAERFGLSQLHQLRGRVGRGSAPGHCLLVNRGPRNTVAEERLRVMERERDGFKIADADLALRGPGELLGTRQSGLGDFRLANLMRDARLLIEARREAEDWLRNDPDLSKPESTMLREILMRRWGRRLELGAVG